MLKLKPLADKSHEIFKNIVGCTLETQFLFFTVFKDTL